MRSAALSLLGITVLLLFLSHTFFFPAPAAAPVVHPKVSLLHGGHIPPEPDHRTKTKAPPSASPAAASAAGTPAAADSRSTPPTVGATGTGAPGLGGHGPFGPESVAPYGIGLGEHGRVYVADSRANAVHVLRVKVGA